MEQHGISIVIPVYNTGKYLRRGLDSLLAQTNGLWEAVCIDDGSTDDSPAILREYAARDARFRVLTQENSGVSVARNRGIREAKGEWVTFLDADDWLSPDLVEKMLTCPCTDKVDAILYETKVEREPGHTEKHEDGQDLEIRSDERGEVCMSPEKLPIVVGSCSGKTYRRSFLLEKGLEFPVGMRQEDEVFYRCAMGVARHVYLLKYQGYHYLQAADSYMHLHTDPGESYLLYLKGARITYAYYAKQGKSPEWMYTLLSFLFEQLCRWREMLGRSQMRKLRKQTKPFMEEGHFAELLSGDYRVRYLSLLPWWVEPFSYRGWNVECFKLLGFTFMKDYYRDFKFVQRTTPWKKIKSLFKGGSAK